MAVTLNATLLGLDPEAIRPGVILVDDPQIEDLIEDANLLFAVLRSVGAVVDFREGDDSGTSPGGGTGDGLFQGVGSTVSTTTASYVDRGRISYRSRNAPTNNNQLHLIVHAAAATANGNARVRVYDTSDTLIDTITLSITTAGSPGLFTGTAAGTALDGDTEYYAKLELQAGALGSVKVYRVALFETVYTSAGSLP